jgi:hypothetical protein
VPVRVDDAVSSKRRAREAAAAVLEDVRLAAAAYAHCKRSLAERLFKPFLGEPGD